MRKLIIITILIAGCGPRVQPGLVDGWYRCIRVVDGDTVVVENVGTIRFADVNAPELDEPGGIEARQAIQHWSDQPVYVTFRRRKSDQTPVIGYYRRFIATVRRHK